MACPDCGCSDLWEDNFWSGCNQCSWMSNCENSVWFVPKQNHSYNTNEKYKENKD